MFCFQTLEALCVLEARLQVGSVRLASGGIPLLPFHCPFTVSLCHPRACFCVHFVTAQQSVCSVGQCAHQQNCCQNCCQNCWPAPKLTARLFNNTLIVTHNHLCKCAIHACSSLIVTSVQSNFAAGSLVNTATLMCTCVGVQCLAIA